MQAEQTIRQAIRTRHHGPTNCKGSRIVASWGGKRKTFPYRYDLNPADNHIRAAALVAAELGWTLSPNIGVFDNDYYHPAI